MLKIKKKDNILLSMSFLLFCVSCEEIDYEARSRYREKSEIRYTVYKNKYAKNKDNEIINYNNGGYSNNRYNNGSDGGVYGSNSTPNNGKNNTNDYYEESDAKNIGSSGIKNNTNGGTNGNINNNINNNNKNYTGNGGSNYGGVSPSYNRKPKNYTGYYKVGQPYVVNGKTYYPAEVNRYKGIGLASWYGEDFHNRKTANGETYDMNDMTAAHKTLPLPSIVRVTNLGNGKSVVVRVNDRGPFVENRIIDLSSRAAEELDIKGTGLAKVKVEFLKKETEKMLKEFGLK